MQEPYNFVTPDVVAAWQSSRSPVGQQKDQTRQEVAEGSQPQEAIDLTEDSTQDSQPPHAAKRRKITHGPNPTTEEQTPEKKPRKVGTVESARFQSVSQEAVAQGGKPNEIKDSYEEDQELSSAGVGKARVEIPVPDGFDRDAYSRVVTSSQLSQPSHTSQLTQSSQPEISSSSQVQTPAPRHKYSSLIWDEDIEGVIPDSQEQPGSSSYKPSETQASKAVSTSLETSEVHTTDLDASGLENTQLTSGGEFSASGTVNSQSAEPLDNFTQASYVDKEVQSSSIQSEAPSTDRDQKQTCTQDSRDNQAQDSEAQESAVASTNSSQLGAQAKPSPGLRTLPGSSLHSRIGLASQGDHSTEQSSGLTDETDSSHNPSAQPVVDQTSLPNLQISSDSSSRSLGASSEERGQTKSPTPPNEIPSSSPYLPISQDPLLLSEEISEKRDTIQSQPCEAPESDDQVSANIEFGTQVPFQRVETEHSHLLLLSPYIRSPSVPSPYVSAVER